MMFNQRIRLKAKNKNIGLREPNFDFYSDVTPNDFIDNIPGDVDSDPFMHSLENLKADDIASPPPKKKLSFYDVVFDIVRYLLLAICLGTFVVSGYMLVDAFIGYWRTDQINAMLAEMFYADLDFSTESFDGEYSFSGDFQLSPALLQSSLTPNYLESLEMSGDDTFLIGDIEVKKFNPNLEKLKANMNNLANKYPNFFAWIKVPGTQINNIVMQTTNNDYYLNHTAEGTYLASGTVFADYRNYRVLSKNFNTIFYGHNMKNGSMFNGVTEYLKEDFFMDYPYVEVYTPSGIYYYEIFSIHKASFDDDYIRTAFATFDEFIEFCYDIQDLSLYKRRDIEFKDKDHILTLSTCTNILQTERYALHAILIKVERN